ncbi:hypothetical protein CLOM_g11660 [Closterium sp. NIES-68]|nr:hypothetical protein CLOM_g11660 [Closterium sp. NIES-68]
MNLALSGLAVSHLSVVHGFPCIASSARALSDPSPPHLTPPRPRSDVTTSSYVPQLTPLARPSWLSSTSQRKSSQPYRRSLRRNAIKIDRSRQPSRPENEVASEADLDTCPAECVREIKSQSELDVILEHAERNNILVVVDFYRTACGSCKYIEQGFAKLCRAEGDLEHPVIFLKHNVMDDYDEQSDIAEALRIKVVPLFHFYMHKNLVESFPTREKSRILETIQKYVPNFQSDDEFLDDEFFLSDEE